ncbi:hypothetical protein Tco_1330143 [Tanacetum coccineum]
MTQEEIQQAAFDEALVSTDDRVKIASCNMRINPSKNQKEATYQVVLDVLKLSSCYNAFLIDVPEFYMQQVPNEDFVAPPPHDSLVTFIKSRGYKGSLEFFSDLYIDHMYQPWRTFASIINRKNVNYAELLWEDFQYQIDYRQTSVKRHESMPYPRFTKVIIHNFLSKHKSISKRYGLLMNSIKDDRVLGRLKFISKGKDNRVYGILIPDVMLNNDIKNSKAYQIYLAISTGIVVLKKARKGIKTPATPKKKGLITADDNIIHDPEEALKLGKSISRIEVEEREKASQVHETHKRIVTKKLKSNEGSDESDDE